MLIRLRGLLWTLVLLVLLAGVPAVVWRSDALTPPSRWPSARQVWDIVRNGRVGHDAAIKVLAVVVMVSWARFVLGVVIALWSSARGRPIPHVWGLGGLARLCSIGVVSGAVLLLAPQSGAAREADHAGHQRVETTRSEKTLPDGGRGTEQRGRQTRAKDLRACHTPVETDSGPPLGLGAAVLVVGGVLIGVDRARRRRLRRAAGDAVTATGAESFEARLREAAPVDRLVRLDLALRLTNRRVGSLDGSSHERVSVTHAVVRADGSLDLALTSPCAALPPFRAEDDGAHWTLPPTTETTSLASLAADCTPSSPMLVHLGTSERGDLFLDLREIRSLSVNGSDAVGVARTVVAGLTASPFARNLLVIAVGVDVGCEPVVASSTVSVSTVASVDDALDLLALHGGASVMVLSATCANDAALATTGSQVSTIVVDGGDSTAWSLTKTVRGWVLEPPGLFVLPVQLDDAATSELRRLLTTADRSIVPAPHPPLGAQRSVERAPAPAPAFVEPSWSFVVRVLGQVDVERRDGTSVVFDKSKSCELLVWLALHRERQSRSGARTAMWDLDVQDATFANIVSEARRALVRADPSGDEWLGRTLGDTLPLHPAIVTDADLLEARQRHAREQSLADAVETLRSGLSWVRGMPCAAAGYRWPDADGTTSRLVILVTSAAVDMATRCLTVGDLDGVFWATDRGLLALPGHEELVGLRMRAHARRGDLSGVRHEWQTYLRALQSDGWGDDAPAPKLVALREELLAPRVEPGGADDRAATTVGVV